METERRHTEIDRISNQKLELMETLDEYFNRGVEKGKFIDTSRIPLICQDISVIHQDVKEIKETITWISRLVIGAVVLALLGVIFVNK